MVALPAQHGATAPPPVATLPSWLPRDAWDEWAAYRLGRKGGAKDWSPTTIAHSLRTLARLRDEGCDPRAVIDQSICAGWTGLFALKGRGGGMSARERREAEARAYRDPSGQRNTFAEARARLIAEGAIEGGGSAEPRFVANRRWD